MKNRFLLTLVWCLLAYHSNAQTFDPAWGARFQAVLDSMTQVNGISKGVTAAIYMPGHGLWKGAAGLSEPGVPLTTSMRVNIGSNSKLFMAVTLLKLQELQQLSLDDHIGKWLPQPMHDVDSSVSIRQLLNHQSGIFDYVSDRGGALVDQILADTSHFFTPEEVVDSIGPPLFPKGQGFHYSNTNYALCAMIIKAATGHHYWKNLHDYILDPLDLESTFVAVYDTAQPHASSVYYGYFLGGWFCTAQISGATGAGDISSTPEDMVGWYHKLFNGQILTDTSIQQLLAVDTVSRYGLGIGDYFNRYFGPAYYHDGGINGFNSFSYFDKRTKATIFICFNNVDDYSFGPYIRAIANVFRNEMPPKADDAGIAGILSPEGTYCTASLTPSLILKNQGSSTLASVQIGYRVDNGTPQVYNWTGNLASRNTENLTLPPIATTNGPHMLTVYTMLPNGNLEGYTFYDTAVISFVTSIAPIYNGSFSESFETGPMKLHLWNNLNSNEANWGITRLAAHAGSQSLGSAGYEDPYVGKTSYADLPEIYLETGSHPNLRFSYAYGPYPGANDSLEVLISNNCGDTWQSLFYKGNDSLGTADPTYLDFFPQSPADWKTVSFPLDPYTGTMQIRFRRYSDWGNNVFLDDISVDSTSVILPLQLLTFTGKAVNGNSALLEWSSFNESNIHLFELQRSTDGRNFIAVGQVNARGRAQSRTSYDYTDTKLGSALYFYRLRIIEKDGKSTLSQVVTISFNRKNSWSVYPVPAKNLVWLNGQANQFTGQKLILTNVQGQRLQTVHLQTLPQSIDLSGYTPGIYFLCLPDKTILKIIKQ